jgi:hypothetical protein
MNFKMIIFFLLTFIKISFHPSERWEEGKEREVGSVSFKYALMYALMKKS